MNNLPGGRVAALRQAFKKATRGREKIRYQALWLLAKGRKRREVMEILGISKQALGDWVTRYRCAGLKSLKDKPQLGNRQQLTLNQRRRLGRLLLTKTPQQLSLSGQFWTVNLVKQLLAREYQVTYRSETTYRKLLRRAGLSFHKPDKVNRKQNPHLIRRFEDDLKKDSPGIPVKLVWSW